MQCSVNLSGLHVPSQDGNRCRCGWVVPPLDVALLEAQRLELERLPYTFRMVAA